MVLLFFGWRLGLGNKGVELAKMAEAGFAEAAAAGFRNVALLYLVLAFLRQITLGKGLALEHFHLPADATIFIKRHMSWFMACIVPLVFVTVAIERQAVDAWKVSLGRLALIAALVILSAFFAAVTRPTGLLMKSFWQEKQGGWFERLRYVWYSFFVFLPLALAFFAFLGYYYAAQQLAKCLQTTILWAFGLSIIYGLTIRWLTVTQNRLALKRERERLVALTEQERRAGEMGDVQQTQDHSPTPPEGLYEIGQQVRRFVRTLLVLTLLVGLWMIWEDVLPALGILNRVALWKTTIDDSTVSITLANLAAALIIVFLTIVAGRNIPAFLELVVLQRLPLTQGVRFAIVTLVRYVIVVIGVVMAFGKISIGWSQVRWLVAAITVGLGFGLQEIFANFVSGLIILFEQPMRVDDIVTVGDVSGKVTRIQIRATTIRKWDRKELVVPNKEFITGHLINWTLSDTVIRMEFPVGIAYGSDTALAKKTLLEVADQNEKVLKDPEPFVIFRTFGNSSLEFDLRLYISSMDNYLEIWSEINFAIDDAFRKARIEIAFPQRDLHLRSVKAAIPIEIKK